MKMGAGLFWGTLLVLLGISLILKVVFNIHFPVIKIVFALFLILLGIKMLVGNTFRFNIKSGNNDVVFNEQRFDSFDLGSKKINVVFGRSLVDIKAEDIDTTKNSYLEISTVFGSADIRIDKQVPVKIMVDAVFSGARLPNGNSAVFGSNSYVSDNFDESKPHLLIKAEVVFGGFDIRYK